MKFKYSNNELSEYINQFYSYFEDGYKFEEFLKYYLEKLGFTEVVVTKRSGDGGIDLSAVRTTVGVFGNENYFIQAKRYKPSSTISPEKIRALRGSINSYGKCVFITTAKVSDRTKEDALHFDPLKPVIVIDGKELVTSCIENEIGFVYNPEFSSRAMDSIMNITPNINAENNTDSVEKWITANDIRARIISIPKFIMEKISDDTNKVDVFINGEDSFSLSVCRPRNYLAKVTSIFKKYHLVDEEGTAFPVKAKWYYTDTIHIDFITEN